MPLHAAAYANAPALADRLIQAGAAVDAEAHGAGGPPPIVALFWGRREVADVLAQHGVTPRNLRAAAGLGSLALVEACFLKDGTLTPNAGAARGSTARTAASRTGSPPLTPRKSSTKPWSGPARATASKCWSG